MSMTQYSTYSLL